MNFVSCTHAKHAAAILAIFNDAILHSTALYEEQPRPPESMIDWFRTKEAGGFPVIGAEDASGRLAGFATYGTFRAYAGYRHTAEHSVYVQKEFQGQGLGHALMTRLIETATLRHIHTLVGVIDAGNPASIALHEKLGFTQAGTLKEAGTKFGRWLDVRFYQLILDTPIRK
ncbi:MAG: N-acetyltransferase family protein [bacterium]